MRRLAGRYVCGAAAALLVGGTLAIVTSVTPAFAAGTLTASPTSSATWATGVPYAQTSPAPTGPQDLATGGTATAPAGITLTAKTCPSGTGVTYNSGPSSGPGIVVSGAPAGLTVYSYGASNTAASSTATLGQTSTIPDGSYPLMITAYSGGASCTAAALSYTLNVQNAVFSTVGGGASGTTLGFYDDSYNQSNGQTVDAVDSDTSGTESFSVTSSSGTGFACYDNNAPVTDSFPNTVTDPTPYDHECNIQAAPGDNDDSGVVGASAYPPQTISVSETDPTYTNNTSPNYTVTVYNPPICGVAPGTTGSLSGTNDATYMTAGDPTIAEACYDGASGPASTLLTGISSAGGTVFANSSPIDGSGGTALTIMAGPGFNWTGGDGSGEADVDTGTAGLNKQAWDYTVASVTVTGGSNQLTVSSGGFPNVFDGMVISGTDIPAGTTVLLISGNTLTMSAQATATPAAETVSFYATTTAGPPSLLTTNASSVASEASFKSSGDGLNTCPPPPADIDAGLPFCFEEYETTGAGPSASQVALDYTGQSLPNTPTVAASPGSGQIGSSIGITDSPGACPATIGSGTTNFLGSSYNCWFARAGDATPVTVTVGGVSQTVTPTSAPAGDVSEGDYTVDGPSDTATYDGAGTITLMNVTGSSNMVSCSATSAGTATAPYSDLLGDGVSGTDIPVGTEVTNVVNSGSGTCSLTLSNAATATPAAETLTFTNVVLNPPQLNASFTLAPGTPTGEQTVDVCEATTPNNGNDWEFGLQWLAPSGGNNLTYVSGSSGPTQVCTTTTIDVLTTNSSTTSAPAGPSIVLGNSNTDVATVSGNDGTPTGSVDFYTCPENVSPCTPTTPGVVPDPANPVSLVGGSATSSSFTPDSTGTWCYAAVYSGDSNYSGSSDESTDECFTVDPASSTTLSTPTSASIVLGESNSDSAAVTGNDSAVGAPAATGSVDFYTCPENVTPCTPTTPGVVPDPANPVALSGGGATSSYFTPDSTGTWCFAAVYSGDSNYNGSSDESTDECFTVDQTGSTTVSTPTSSSIVSGDSNTDMATVMGNDAAANAPAPTGTVDFYWCPVNVSPCTPTTPGVVSDPANPVPLVGDSATSSSFTPDSAGTWCYAAVYSGDSNYTGSSDESTDECFTVAAASSTTVSAPTNSSISLGGSNSDVATVNGNDTYGTPTGSVDFYQCPENVSPCTPTTPGVVPDPANPVSLVAGSATSSSFTPDSAGTWCYAAVYSGDSNYTGSSDESTDECFTVNQVGSSSVSAPSSSTASLDGPNSDTVLITGDDGAGDAPYPTGTVTFYTCGENVEPCTSALWHQLGSPVTLGTGAGNTNSAISATFDNTSPGTWCFAAVYSGDANYTGSSDEGADECYTVSQDTSSTISAPVNTNITEGQSNADEATVTGNSSVGAPTGTVKFYQCGPTATETSCASGTQVGGAVNLTTSGSDTATAASAAFTPPDSPSSIGYWCFRAVYSGDSNYLGSTDNTVDECFYVTGPLTITTTSPLPDGVKHSFYSVQLDAVGGTGAYTWSSGGTLPPGLSVSASGLLSGTPTHKGTYTFKIKVKDSTSPHPEKAKESVTLTIT